MISEFPIVLYGAGGRAAFEKEKAEACGYNFECFVDADINKQETVYLGLPVLSLERAKEQLGNFYLYLTPEQKRHREIFEYLLERGIEETHILNAMEECASCSMLDTHLILTSEGIFGCCVTNDTVNSPPNVRWDDNDWDTEITLTKFFDMRNALRNSIRLGEKCNCTGCSQIQNSVRPIKNIVSVISFTFNCPCQLSCNYCVKLFDKDHFYLGFDYKRFVGVLERRRLLARDASTTWGNGEVTIHPRVDDFLDAVCNYKLYLFTNAVVYNERIAEMSARPGSCQVVSIDAGTPKTYKLIKGMDAYDTVFANVKNYSNCGANMFLKYIFIKENSNEDDVIGFVNMAIETGAKKIIIAADHFRREPFSDEQLRLMVKMLNMAEQNGLAFEFALSIKQDEREAILQLKSQND